MLTLTNDQLAALAQQRVMRRFFIWVDALNELGEPDPFGLWDDVGIVQLEGKTYYGSGNVVSIVSMSATSDFSINELKIKLSGVEDEFNDLARAPLIAQRPITVSVGIFDPATRTLFPPLVRRFSGVIDDIEIVTPEAGGKAEITVTCESTSRALTIKRTDTRSRESCVERAPTDRFYDYTAGQSERVIWFSAAGGSVQGRRT